MGQVQEYKYPVSEEVNSVSDNNNVSVIYRPMIALCLV